MQELLNIEFLKLRNNYQIINLIKIRNFKNFDGEFYHHTACDVTPSKGYPTTPFPISESTRERCKNPTQKSTSNNLHRDHFLNNLKSLKKVEIFLDFLKIFWATRTCRNHLSEAPLVTPEITQSQNFGFFFSKKSAGILI